MTLQIYYQGFPSIFCFGQGIGRKKGLLNLTTRRFLLRHFSRRCGCNHRLIMYIHNTKFRGDAGRAASASIKTDSISTKKFFDFFNEPNIENRLDMAIQNPDSEDAKYIIRTISPSIMIQSSKIPYSPYERGTRAVTEVLAMCRFFDLPNVFYTIGYDERRNALIARIACMSKDDLRQNALNTNNSSAEFWKFGDSNSNYNELCNKLFNDIINDENIETIELWHQKLSEHISNDPAAIVMICNRLCDSFHQYLFNIPKEQKKSFSNFSFNPPGVFGRGKGWFTVTEVTGRKMVHIHGLAWVGHPQWLLQKIALSNKFKKDIVTILNSVYQSYAPPRVHALNLLRRLFNVKYLKSSFFAAPNPSDVSMNDIKECGNASMVNKNGHSHCPTCRKGNRGKYECRLAYPRSTDTDESPRILVRKVTSDKHIYPVVMTKQPNTSNNNNNNDLFINVLKNYEFLVDIKI